MMSSLFYLILSRYAIGEGRYFRGYAKVEREDKRWCGEHKKTMW